MKLFTVAEMVEAERLANERGHRYDTMMELAGKGVAEAIMARHAVAGKTVLVLVGGGNNGGDGLVAAHYLNLARAKVTVCLVRERASTDTNFKRLQRPQIDLIRPANARFKRLVQQSDFIIDAVLGTGVNKPIRGALAQQMADVHEHLAARHIPPVVVAVDCPSGMHCDTGAWDPLALPADLTVSFGGAKRGHYCLPASAKIGELCAVDIGLTPKDVAHVRTNVASDALIGRNLPPRPLDGHKGTFGTVLVIGGSAEYWGAPYLSALAAYRAGCGLVRLAVPTLLRPTMATQLPEATFVDLAGEQRLGAADVEPILQHVTPKTAIVLGPGLGTNSAEFLDHLFAHLTNTPNRGTVVDADALNWLSTELDWWERLPPNAILTPHPGEMKRLTGQPVPTANRIGFAQQHATAWQQTVVLKGAITVVAAPDGDTTLIPVANPLLATAGSGDVLAGTIASICAQTTSLTATEQALVGAYLHAQAATHLTDQFGQSGALASELANALPTSRQRLTDR